VRNANNFKGKDSGPDKLHVDGIKKLQVRGESMKGATWMEGNSHGEDTRCFLLRKRKGFRLTIYFKKKDGLFYLSRHGSGCEHKGHSKKTNVKTSAVHTKKSELKTVIVKAMVQSPIKARGAGSLLEKITWKIIHQPPLLQN
jgi:hypothetical protein